MAVKYGDFSSFRLKPTWEDSSKSGKDSNGWKRGARGFANSRDDRDFMKSADPSFDKIAYGGAPNGATADPSQLTDRFKGAKGVDAGEPDHGDDGTR